MSSSLLSGHWLNMRLIKEKGKFQARQWPKRLTIMREFETLTRLLSLPIRFRQSTNITQQLLAIFKYYSFIIYPSKHHTITAYLSKSSPSPVKQHSQ